MTWQSLVQEAIEQEVPVEEILALFKKKDPCYQHGSTKK